MNAKIGDHISFNKSLKNTENLFLKSFSLSDVQIFEGAGSMQQSITELNKKELDLTIIETNLLPLQVLSPDTQLGSPVLFPAFFMVTHL